MDLNFFNSKHTSKILYILGALIIALLVFKAGEEVGYHKAGVAYHMGAGYYNAFVQMRDPMHMDMPFGMFSDDFPEAHGATGKIVKIDLPTVIIADKDGTEKSVAISDDTVIRKLRSTIKPADLSVDDTVVVFGVPNSAQVIDATLIRVIPPPPQTATTTPSVTSTTTKI